MRYQDYLKELFAAIEAPVCCVSSEGRLLEILLPVRFKNRQAYEKQVLYLAKSFAYNIGDPFYLSTLTSQGGIRLPDYSVVLIGPIVKKETASNRRLNFTVLRCANLWLKLISQMITHDVIPPGDYARIEEEIAEFIPESLKEKTENQPLGAPHNQYRYEAIMLDAIRSGDLDLVERSFKVPMGGKFGTLGPTPLRSMQNHAHNLNSLASRAAISAGILSEDAYSLSDKFFMAAERCTTVEECLELRKTIARSFALMVKKYREAGSAAEKPLISRLKAQLKSAVFAKEDFKAIAAECGCTQEHASRQFRKAEGMTMGQYLTGERLKTAQELLKSTSTKIADIAELLHFASSAHFCRVFKEQEGMTPAAYRAAARGTLRQR